MFKILCEFRYFIVCMCIIVVEPTSKVITNHLGVKKIQNFSGITIRIQTALFVMLGFPKLRGGHREFYACLAGKRPELALLKTSVTLLLLLLNCFNRKVVHFAELFVNFH